MTFKNYSIYVQVHLAFHLIRNIHLLKRVTRIKILFMPTNYSFRFDIDKSNIARLTLRFIEFKKIKAKKLDWILGKRHTSHILSIEYLLLFCKKKISVMMPLTEKTKLLLAIIRCKLVRKHIAYSCKAQIHVQSTFM